MRRARAALPLLLLLPSLAQAQEAVVVTRQAQLSYARLPGSERCPDEATLRGAVAARLGYDPFAEQADNVVTVEIARAGRGLRATIALTTRGSATSGRRVLSSPRLDCTDLGPTLELAISIAIDPLSLDRPAPPTTPPPAIPPTPPATTPPAPPRAPESKPDEDLKKIARPRPPDPLRPRAGVGVLVNLGTAPTVTAGFLVEAGLRRRRWSVGLEARYDLAGSAATSNGQVTIENVLGTFSACVYLSWFAGCGLATAGIQMSSGATIDGPRRQFQLFLAPGARLAVEIPLWLLVLYFTATCPCRSPPRCTSTPNPSTRRPS